MSLVIYRGPSSFSPAHDIRAVLVTASSNRKTGGMVQLHILPDTVEPHRAQRTGADHAVCGECPLRPALNGGCYVVTCQGPLSTWRATDGKPVAGAAQVAAALRGRTLRLGAYGDPAALPAWLVPYLARLAGGRVTGYTHGHLVLGLAGVEHLRSWCMLSVETRAQATAAHDVGWRTFRSRAPGAPLMPSEIECPSERVTCSECLLCRGASIKARSIAIEVHGSRSTKALQVVE